MENPDLDETPRLRRNFESTETRPQTLGQFITYLRISKIDPRREFYEAEISVDTSPIEPQDIRGLPTFPFEFQITEQDGKIHVATGLEETVPKDVLKIKNAKMHLHSHPEIIDKKGHIILVNTPSFSDLRAIFSDDNERIGVLVHSQGLMIFRRPIYNPLTQMPTLDDPREIEIAYCKSKGVYVEGRPTPGFRSFFDLSDEEQVELQRQFAEDTQIIIQEATWEDTKAVTDIMDVINLRKTIDSELPAISSCLDGISLGELTDSQANQLESLGGLIDTIRNKYGTFGDGKTPATDYIQLVKDILSQDLAKEETSGLYKEYVERLLSEANGLT